MAGVAAVWASLAGCVACAQMSGGSIGGRLQGLEQRLRAAQPGPPRHRPRPAMTIGGHRPRNQLELTQIPPTPVSQASVETDEKLREILKMSGVLTIDGVQYPSKISDLQHLSELGNGTCGHVVKMLHKPSNATIAVKQMRRSGNSEENKRILMDLEVVLRSHDCPYIVRCLGYFITEADVWICMELMASCFDKILKRLIGPIPEEVLGKVTVATVNALSYLKEEHGVIHRDVKPSNILIDERGVVKLCDFGISGRLVDSKAKTRSAGCAAYMAPERIDPPDPQKPDYDIRADVWSLGITLVELATGYFPYRDCKNDFEVLSKVIEEEPPALPDTPSFSEDFKSFVHKCLTKDYLQRPKYAELLRHPFVESAAGSGTNVGSWVSSALPPGSPRIATTPPVFRRRIHHTTSSEEKNKLSDHSPSPSVQSNGFSLQLTAPEHKPPILNANKQSDSTSISSVKEKKISLSPPSDQINKLTGTQKNGEQSDHSSSDNELLSYVINSPALLRKKSQMAKIAAANDAADLFNKTANSSDSKNTTPKLDILTNSKNPFLNQLPNTSNTSAENNCDQARLISPDKDFAISDAENFQIRSHVQQVHIEDSKEYELNSPHRIRSLSNTILYSNNSERWPPPKYVSSPPNTNKYYANIEMRNQPFPGGGGGPPSIENYPNHNRRQELIQSDYHPYRSPDVNRKQYFSPIRNKKSSSFEQTHGSESPRNISSPTNFALARNDENESQTPCFKTNEPTNYFTSTSVCTMSRYSINPAIRNRNGMAYAGSYHQNPGGSCSQPASLEAYGDVRHTPRGYPRVPEKSFSPPLWSPQPAPRWAGRERDERDAWHHTNDANHHQQGNTSPIVLQRFYHQQGQRRSRRDWDSNPRQSSSSLSREASIGRSPEPPRRAHRDPSLPREHPSSQVTEHPLLREWRERERTPSQHRVPMKNEPVTFCNDASHQSCENSRNHHCFSPIARRNREQIVNDANAQFESKMKMSTYHHHMREKDPRDELNGDCNRTNDGCNTSPMNEQIRLEKKHSKERYSSRDKRNEHAGQCHKDGNNQCSPFMMHKQGRNHGKDRDEQGGSRSSSPSGVSGAGGSVKGSRSALHPRRIGTTDYEDMTKVQDSPNSFILGMRANGPPPQPPPRRTTDSWSLPASPLPTRPI